MVHGYDYCSVGSRKDVEWFRKQLDSRFSIKTTVVGDKTDDAKEVRVLNRVFRYMEQGWEYEADQRHAEIIINDLDMKNANPVASAGEDEKPHEVEENLVELYHHRIQQVQTTGCQSELPVAGQVRHPVLSERIVSENVMPDERRLEKTEEASQISGGTPTDGSLLPVAKEAEGAGRLQRLGLGRMPSHRQKHQRRGADEGRTLH